MSKTIHISVVDDESGEVLVATSFHQVSLAVVFLDAFERENNNDAGREYEQEQRATHLSELQEG